MRSRVAFSAATLLLAALIPASYATAQDIGGFGGRGGGGRNAGGLDMSLAPFYSDLTGPFAFDSVQVLLSLEESQRAKLDQIRADHLAKTQPLRDSIGRLAVVGGLYRPDPGGQARRDGRQGEGAQGLHQASRKAAQDRQRLLPQDGQAGPQPGQWVSYKEWVQMKWLQRGAEVAAWVAWVVAGVGEVVVRSLGSSDFPRVTSVTRTSDGLPRSARQAVFLVDAGDRPPNPGAWASRTCTDDSQTRLPNVAHVATLNRMPRLSRSYRRLLIMLLVLPVTLLVLALVYQFGMGYLEGQPRTLTASFEWAAETMTTTGYGRDTGWTHPLMQAYVISVQFIGLFMMFLIFPVFIIPFFEERFEARLSSKLPSLKGQVLIYRYGPAVTSLIQELDQAKVPVTIFEEDGALARRLSGRGRKVVLGNLEEEDPDLSNLVGARGLVLNGNDNDNASMALAARYHGFTGPVLALMDDPLHRPPMIRAGATAAFTPDHVLAAALAARASARISPRVAGVRHLGQHLEVAELRLHAGSPLAGKTIAEAGIRAQTGATIVGMWVAGELLRQPPISTRLDPGTILVVVGSHEAIGRLGTTATAAPRRGAILLIGHGSLGQKVAELLKDAEENFRVLAPRAAEGVDIVGDPLNAKVLEQAGAREAQAIVLTLESDSSTIFTAAVIRSLAPDAVVIAGTRRVENVSRIHRAGADFALSVSQVAGQLLTYHILGQESVSLEAAIKLVATSGESLTGRPLEEFRIRVRTGCSVVAVERGDQVIVEFDPTFEVLPDDTVYVSGTSEAVATYFKGFPNTRAWPTAQANPADVG